MSINLALILTALTVFTGMIVAYDKFYLRKLISDSDGFSNKVLKTTIDYSRSFFPVLLFVLVIRSFIFEPFRIPSGSMMPTLLSGDYIFVKKYSYGLRLPVIEKKIFDIGGPKRGDVVVFRLPSEPNINYIKRVIGLPGDELVYERHRLTINGESIDVTRDVNHKTVSSAARYIEQLGERKHAIFVTNASYSMRDGTYRVPDDHYFMMGDNRDNSRDSRFIGTIPEAYLVGEAVRIWMHMDGFEWPEWQRIGMKIE